ncbi:hypothetical protein BDN70DRAFT_847745 [Pholiota conissans]|uniref:Rho-GAP domain-containing protein n=1 Tax=Pholiota conissans TaxID=109636 RepID=A0A9P5ZDJ0_9AGAR|nr:hypothetical protein BDN70DRAFT_847745 [Pholiota conissans]
MAVLSLPLTFGNSFWSQDYRKGLEVLYGKLEQGVVENDEIVTFIRARAQAESNLANSLINPLPTGKSSAGFGADDGASLFMAFRGLQAESAAQGQAHNTIAKELETLVADPFDDWARSYKDRLKQNKATVIDNWLRSYEHAQTDVAKLKSTYLAKVRRADEAEDDVKFAPNSGGSSAGDKFTSSPRMRPIDSHRSPPQRTASVSERIAQRLKEIQKKSAIALAHATSTEDPNASEESLDEEKPLPVIDKGKGKERDFGEYNLASPPPMSPLQPPKNFPDSDAPPSAPQPILLAGLSFTPVAVSQLLSKAATELPLRSVRFPLLGEYHDAFTGEEFVAWLQEHVQGFGGSLDLAEEAAMDLTQREGLLRRLGELGNLFEDSEDAWYQFRPKAFELGTDSSAGGAHPENLLKKTGNLVNLVSKALNANNSNEPAYIRARHEADEADKAYRIAVRRLDRHRLALEERVEDTLKILQRWESERLRAVKTVLLQYQGTIANLPKSLEPSIERSGTLVASYQPESDLTALIERYRTGPFRPSPQIYESVAHDESDVVFGIDLRKWAEGGWYTLTQGEGATPRETIPPVLTALLLALDAAYERAPNDVEKRKSWIYEVPLGAVHQLRESLNTVSPGQPFPQDLISKFDAPVIAACIKLWALELNPPLALYEGWEEFRKLYPTVGGGAAPKAEGDEGEETHLQLVSAALLKLPKVHLYVLDAILKHLKNLVATTKSEETDEVFFTKIALSMGRTILRPKVESELSIQDRHPSLLVLDLLNHYDALLPPTIERKKRESVRTVPIRKRTAPIDMRLSRSRISVGADAQQLLAAEKVAQNPSLAGHMRTPSDLSAITAAAAPALAASVPPPPPPPVVAPAPAVIPPPPPPVVAAATPLVPPPPPPVLEKAKTPPPPPPVLATPPPPPPLNAGLQRPSFKDPPPESDNLPPRPAFKEPPPELDDLPPRPAFADPPPESDAYVSAPSSTSSSPSIPPPPAPATKIIPPTPQKRSLVDPVTSRSPSPKVSGDDVVLGSGKSTIARSGSAQAAGMRGPRLARGARGGSSGSVQNLVQNLNRNSQGSPPTPVSPGNPKINRLSGSPVRRPSSVVGRSAATSLSRRTMASDAEDDVVDKK